MKTVEHFSEAARLYADNIDVVGQMKSIYEAELRNFVEKVVERVPALIKPAKLCRHSRQMVESLWIGEDEEKELEQEGISVWFYIRQPEIIREGRLDVAIELEGDTYRQQFNRLAAHPDFTPSSNRGSKSFNVRIDLRSGDSVEVAAARLATMLQAIDAIHKA